MKKLLAAASLALLTTCASAPAFAADGEAWEKRYLALSAVDTAQTCYGIAHGKVERNPILGKKPSCEKLVAFKIGTGVIHYLTFKLIDDSDPDAAKTFAKVSAFVQGGIVGWNFTVLF